MIVSSAGFCPPVDPIGNPADALDGAGRGRAWQAEVLEASGDLFEFECLVWKEAPSAPLVRAGHAVAFLASARTLLAASIHMAKRLRTGTPKALASSSG